MRRRFSLLLTLALGLTGAAFACREAPPAAPLAPVRGSAVSDVDDDDDDDDDGDEDDDDGDEDDDDGGQSRAAFVRCERQPAQYGSADIGPSGGQLVVGNNRLIVPPGALRSTVRISATIPDDTLAFIAFAPRGLVFKKPVGLIMDATGCDIPDWEAPDIAYVVRGQIIERIQAVYSNQWKAVAAPIKHFSGYLLAW